MKRCRWPIVWSCCARAVSCRSGSPQEIYDRPADAFVADFVGRANLIDGRVIDAETVDTAIGRLATRRHGHAAGSALRLLVRPERVEIGAAASGENVFAAQVLRDRFFGATRQLEVAAGDRGDSKWRNLACAIMSRSVRVPREAIQFLNAHERGEDHATDITPTGTRDRPRAAGDCLRARSRKPCSTRPSSIRERKRFTKRREKKAWSSASIPVRPGPTGRPNSAAFKKRYPEVEIVYNDIGSAATVVALDKARNRPQADTAYYFAGSAFDAVSKDVVAPFKPVNFDKLPPVFRDPDGKWFTIHT